MNKLASIIALNLCASFGMAVTAPVSAPTPAVEKIFTVTTLPVLAALVQAIGKDHVLVQSLISADQDPHTIKALPTYKVWVDKAKIFFQIGRELELPVSLVIDSSNNAELKARRGLITTSAGCLSLEVPTVLSREQGDIHPQGNPHLWLSPSAVRCMVNNITLALQAYKPSLKDAFESNKKAFNEELSKKMFGEDLVKKAGNSDFLWRLHEGDRLKAYLDSHKLTVGGWLKKAQEINYSFYSYHKDLSYFAKDFNLSIAGQIEEKSGVAPSARYLQELISKAIANKITHIVAASYYSGNIKLLSYISERTNGAYMFITIDCKPKETYINFIDRLFDDFLKLKNIKAPVPNTVKAKL